MYEEIKSYLIKVNGDHIDPWVVQEIDGYFKSLEVTKLSPELLSEAETLYNYLISGRAFFGGQR